VYTFLLLSIAVAVAADNPKPSDARVALEPRVINRELTERSDNIRVDSNLVLIPVTVTDRHSRLVTGLDREYFKIFEDKVEQTIIHFGMDDAPVSVGVVLDCSGSMSDKLGTARKALAQFLKTASSGDEFSLVAFSDRPELLSGFTGEIEEIQNRLPFATAAGATALLDAVVLTVRQMKFARNPRKAILIISDGVDNASRATVKEVEKLVREADVQIFAIAILDALGTYEERLGPVLLREISVQTGGQLFKVDKLNSLPEIASKIGLALRLRYVLGYAPSNVVKDGKYHKINVKLAQPVDKLNLRLSWRLGYYAPFE
jgi:VWFA-related protein